jgi:hypothetical protein
MLEDPKEQANVVNLFHAYRKIHKISISLVQFVAFTGLGQHLKTDKSRRILRTRIDEIVSPEVARLDLERYEIPSPKGGLRDIEYRAKQQASKSFAEANPVKVTVDPSLATWRPAMTGRGKTVKEMELASNPLWLEYQQERSNRRKKA